MARNYGLLKKSRAEHRRGDSANDEAWKLETIDDSWSRISLTISRPLGMVSDSGVLRNSATFLNTVTRMLENLLKTSSTKRCGCKVRVFTVSNAETTDA